MKTKALISFAVIAKLICVFVFAYAKSRFMEQNLGVKKDGLCRRKIVPKPQRNKTSTLAFAHIDHHAQISPGVRPVWSALTC